MTCFADCVMHCVRQVMAIFGSVRLPPKNKLKGGSGKMSKRGTCFLTGRWPGSLNTTCVTNGCRLRTSGKELLGPMPARSMQELPASASITHRAYWAECPEY